MALLEPRSEAVGYMSYYTLCRSLDIARGERIEVRGKAADKVAVGIWILSVIVFRSIL